jgi:hypothetical protein
MTRYLVLGGLLGAFAQGVLMLLVILEVIS